MRRSNAISKLTLSAAATVRDGVVVGLPGLLRCRRP